MTTESDGHVVDDQNHEEIDRVPPMVSDLHQKMKVVLISPYEIGRQPFGLAQPAAWLSEQGIEVVLNDLAVEPLASAAIKEADVVGLYLAMHTATRLGINAIGKVRSLNPQARIFAFGLYAPMNDAILRANGVNAVFSGEAEPAICDYVTSGAMVQSGINHSLKRIDFKLPVREKLPALTEYAHLKLPNGDTRTVAFAETSRGCKHLCRHCPVVPVYEGRFVAVPVDVVIADVAQQIATGATHVSFGDPDFLNGPTHALRVLEKMNERFPDLSFDATVKIEHILKHPEVIARMGESGCLFLTCAFESFEDDILDKLDKGHSFEDVERALAITRAAGIVIEPTFIPFTPWTTLESFRDMLVHIREFGLIDSVAPVQLAIRLLVPNGSKLFDLDGFDRLVDDFDEQALGFPWQHRDPRVDALQQQVMSFVDDPAQVSASRRSIFGGIWKIAHDSLGEHAPQLDALVAATGQALPTLSEDWYCCAEPSCAQLGANSFDP